AGLCPLKHTDVKGRSQRLPYSRHFHAGVSKSARGGSKPKIDSSLYGITFFGALDRQASVILKLRWEGTPVQIDTMRERGAEGAGSIPYLRDRFPDKPRENMPKRIKQAIENFEKSK